MNKKLLLVVLVCFSVGLGAHFSYAQDKKQSQRIQARMGEVFVIALDSNRTTGYAWQLAKPPDKNKVEFICSKYKKVSIADRVGVGGEDLMIFKAVGLGKTTLTFKYVRFAQEKDKRPLKKKTFVVIIKQPVVDEQS